ETRVQRVLEMPGMENLTVDQAKERMTKTDKSRASYYNYFTNKVWGQSCSYSLSIDASVLGIDETVRFLKEFVECKYYK
ncbi:MAG: cytidylate kinase-like family protein, partial [Tannerellaceae bacterium]|nr:cytidylate kinase-like family protein [Tannerellaceae bacterium]